MNSRDTRDPHARRVVDALRRIVQALRVSARAAESNLGLSAAQLFVLQKLAEEPTLSVNDLSDRTLTHQSSVSVVVTRLVDKGLVTRVRSPHDARRQLVSLTPAGRAALRRSPQAAQEILIDALRRMTAKDRAALANGLDRLTQFAGLADQPAQLFFDSVPDTPTRTRKKATRHA
jgi:DNA-binding MarR family transcriptional regulator